MVSVTPQFLERGILWFKENLPKIKHAIKSQSFWQNNALFVEKDMEIKPGEFLRKITDFGYIKTGKIFGKGEFSHKGNIIDIWPINSDTPYKIEFFGNKIENILCQNDETSEIGEMNNKTFHQVKRSGSPFLSRIRPGDYVVHVDHGIGIFRGYTTKNEIRNDNPPAGGETLNKHKTQNPKHQNGLGFRGLNLEFAITKKSDTDFFVVEYAPPKDSAEPDRLYVPLDQEKRLSVYIGFETPSIHRLGGNLWANTKKRVREDAEKEARDLIKIYAARESMTRPPYKTGESMEREFASDFEHTETEDQIKALEDIKKDLTRNRPMDRIICGDVGFGKTEVAMRIALTASLNNRQTVFITPTTILANEHGKNFEKRFKKFPIGIRVLSRLTPPTEEKKIIDEIKNGKCDIIIGTHRLLSKDVFFKNLGLVIIDEEQKFGVRQKEKFKEMRGECDILSLSATPIPRTLNLAISRLRDISIIKTPPLGRIPIKTFILPYSLKTFARAIMAEIERNGQIYFLHNRIETIEKTKEKIWSAISREKTDTKIKIETIHGKTPEKTMIRVMNEFRGGKTDMLIATTIIENGLDFSNANTLIVDDGTRLGLSQAHQIRGRIGRGDKKAYAYFAYKSQKMTDDAMERLTALKEFEELGSGYEIAMRDLEIRGAGNILGREQSGAINRVGLNLYCQILAEAVENLKTAKNLRGS